jgi:mono/diheme cytochrome c family protein
MALNPVRIPPAVPPTSSVAPGGSAGSALSAATPGTPNLASGRKLYSQVCVSCHGPDGNLIADHKLGNLKARRDFAATVGYIKDPRAPMPKLYPDLIDEQSVIDVSAFLREELTQ